MSRRWRRVLGSATVASVVVASVYLVSWLDTDPIEPPPFFAVGSASTTRTTDAATTGTGTVGASTAAADGVLVFAHQGGEALAPSNTMAAFTNAVAVGADVLDADMHLTADDVPVLLHDTTVDRTSNGSGPVAELTLAELRDLDFGHSFTSNGGATYPFRNRNIGIVTVEELFTEFAGSPDLRFNIEIKQTAVDAAAVFCDLIQRFDLEHRVMVSSFTQPNMDAFRAACPDVATAATENEVRTFYILHRVGLIGLVGGLGDPPYQSLQVPEESGRFRILTAGFVADARSLGVPVVPWTINDRDDLERVLALDVAGINTDHPDRLRDIIAER